MPIFRHFTRQVGGVELSHAEFPPCAVLMTTACLSSRSSMAALCRLSIHVAMIFFCLFQYWFRRRFFSGDPSFRHAAAAHIRFQVRREQYTRPVRTRRRKKRHTFPDGNDEADSPESAGQDARRNGCCVQWLLLRLLTNFATFPLRSNSCF